jgi:hypothetical protein
MRTLRFSVPINCISASYLGGLLAKKEKCNLKDFYVTGEKSKHSPYFGVIIINCEEGDASFWLGFIEGSHWTIDNRQAWNLK